MKVALLLVDHGSVVEESNQLLHHIADGISQRRPALIVEIAHMELAEPTIADGFANCVNRGAEQIVVHPYMLAPGRHATRDIPRLVRDIGAHYPGIQWRVTPPLGLHEKLCEIVLERAEL